MHRVLILKFPYSSLFGGGEKHTLTMVEQLRNKGFEFYFAGSCRVLLAEFRRRRWPARRWWAGPEPVSKGTIVLWPFTALAAGIALVVLLLWYRIRVRVRIVYCSSLTEKILVTIPARLLGMRVFWVEHVTFDRWLTRNPLRLLYRWSARWAHTIAVSQVIRTQLVDEIHVSASRVQVIYPGIDLRTFMRKEHQWHESARFNIGCVARLEKEKGIEYLLHAVKIIKEFIPFVRLIVVGEGSERKKLIWLTERLELKEMVQWVGRQRNVEKWYHYFDTYVLPSVIRESFGLTIIEAMASGIPVVASRIGGTSEIITHQRNGLLAEPGNSQDLADQLLWLFNNRPQAQEMAEAAYQRVLASFSLERMARDYYILFRGA